MPDAPAPPPRPKRIDYTDPTVRTMALYLRKEAEFKAKQEMERLLEAARQQAGDAPKDL